MKHKSQPADSVHLAIMPKPDTSCDYMANIGKWEKIMNLRDEVLRTLEALRQEQKIASNQEACVLITCDDDGLIAMINDFGIESFATLCIVSGAAIEKGSELKVTAQKSDHQKCDRCWNYWPSVGTDNDYPDLCTRCADVIKNRTE